jgi:FAD/FMN-containing dehydrogenase
MSETPFSTQLGALLPPGRTITDDDQVERLSKDFYWYSPVLERQLHDKKADFAVAPESIDDLAATLAFAYAHDIPVTVRGAGTGNYGQAVPLFGGIVLDLARLDRIIEITPDGIIRAEPGARLGSLEEAARKVGWELRCYPSTWVKASVGGFISGGSGGIGSIMHGGLRDNGTVHALEVMTLEAKPRRVWLRGDEIFQVLHGWGTTGVVITVELKLAPKVPWGQIAATFDTFDACLDFTEKFANHSPWRKRLVTCFQDPIPSYFKPLQKFVPPGKALVLLELETDGVAPTAAEIEAAGGTAPFQQPWSEKRPGPLLSDYTWNHTTLWAKKADPTLTYLQVGFDRVKMREQMARLREKFGDEFIHHMEFMKIEGHVTPGAIPIIRFTTEERLREIVAFCRAIGVGVSDPHSFQIEAAGRWRESDPRLAAKNDHDPKGLLNPGKMKGYPLPPALQKMPQPESL